MGAGRHHSWITALSKGMLANAAVHLFSLYSILHVWVIIIEISDNFKLIKLILSKVAQRHLPHQPKLKYCFYFTIEFSKWF